jgi:hypothetical protein
MKTMLLSGVALALVIGVSSAAYANPKNTFSNYNFTAVYSEANAVSTGNNTLGSGNGGNGGDSTGVGVGAHYGLGVGVGKDGGNGGDGKVENGDVDNHTTAISESFNKNNDGVSVQTLVGVSAVNVQAAVGYLAINKNGGATSKNIDTDGIAVSGATAGIGTQNIQGVSIGAAAEVSF